MDEDELLARALEILQRRASGARGPSLTVRQIYEKYEAFKKRSKSWPRLQDRLVYFVTKLGDRDVASLKPLDWTDHRLDRSQMEIPTGKPGRRYCDNTINQELKAVKTMFNWGVVQGRIASNPFMLCRIVKTRDRRTTAPREDDIVKVLAVADARLRYLWLAAVDAGMRRTEAAFCRRSWVDFEAGVIRLDGTVCKGGKSRTVPTTGRLLDAIRALPRSLHDDTILINPNTDKPYSRDMVHRWFREAADAAGIKAADGDGRVVFHDGRHAHASNSVSRGVRIEVVSKNLGHASLNTTLVYVHTDERDVREGAAIFEAGLKRELEERRGPRKAPLQEGEDGKNAARQSCPNVHEVQPLRESINRHET